MDFQMNPLVMFALDAADWNDCVKYISKGLMPVMQRLLEEGSYAVLQDEDSICELGLYNIMFSGQSREEIGYTDFRQIVPGTYKIIHDVEGEDFGANPFWEYFENTGKKVCVLDVYDARLLPGLNGVQLAQWSVNNMKRKTTVFPENLAEEIPELKEQLLFNQIVPATIDQNIELYANLMKRLDKKLDVYSKILKRDQYDFIGIGFGEVHCSGHQFFDFNNLDPENSTDERVTQLITANEKIYQKIDFCIGELLKLVPPNSNVVILSQSGMMALYPMEDFINKVCNTLGYQKFRHPSLSSYFKPGTILRKMIPKTARFRLSRKFLSKKQRDHQLTLQYENGTDWYQTKVFALPTMFQLFLRINLKGREEKGIVEEKEYDQLVETVMEELRYFTDSETGKPLLNKIIKVKGTFTDSIPFKLPDIMASYHSFDKLVKEISHRDGYKITQSENFFFRSNEHSDIGFFAGSGPDIPRNGEMKNIKFKDLAPTFTKLIGANPDRVYRGKSFI